MDNVLKAAPRIGMGCWAIGGPFWNGDVAVGYSGGNDRDSKAAIEASWDCGVRVFDTSAVYGSGHSETLLGETLAKRDDAIIVSKFGHSFDATTKQMLGPRFEPDYIRQSVGDSCRRLNRGHIDVLLLHLNELNPDRAEPLFDTLEELRQAGTIGAYGWSTDFPRSVCAMATRPGFTTVQHAMNLFIDAPTMIETTSKHNLTQLIRSPLAMGVLTGKFDEKTQLPTDDVRGHESNNLQGFFPEGRVSRSRLKTLEGLREVLTSDGRSLAQGALCWLLARSQNALPKPGAKTAAQAEENAAALALGPLSDHLMREIETLIDRPAEGEARAL